MPSIRNVPDNLGEASALLHRTLEMDSLRKDGVPSFSMAAKAILRILNEQINVCSLASLPELSDGVTLKSDKLADIRTRFLLWTGNLGVMHEAGDPRALDRRVNGAPEVANRIRDILRDLQDLLGQCGSFSNSTHPYCIRQLLIMLDQINNLTALKLRSKLSSLGS